MRMNRNTDSCVELRNKRYYIRNLLFFPLKVENMKLF